MADNVVMNAGSGGDTLAADDVGGVKYPIGKLAFGALDSVTLAASGAGAVSAGVQRTTLASDDPAVALLTTIDADTGNLAAIAASVAAIDTDTTTIIGHVDGIETLIGTTNTTLTTIDGRVDGIEGLLSTTNTNTGNAATSLAVMDDWDNGASDGASVSGDVAHDAADAGEPVKIGGYAKAAAPTDVSADGDRVNAWFDLGGRLAIQDGGLSLSIDDGGNTITVDGTVAVTNGGLTELAAAINASSQMDVNIAASGATVPVSNAGLTELAAAINASSQMDVNIAASGATVPVSNAGITTIAGAVSGTEMQVDVLTLPNVTLAAGTNTNEVVGDVAHDAAASGNPIMVAGAAQNMDDTAPPNRVSAEGDSTRIATDWDGAQFSHPHGPQIWSYHLDTSTAQTDTTVHSSPGAGLSLYVTDIVFSSGAATAINLFFEEGSTKVLGPYYLEAVAGRGAVIRFTTPKKITAATALTLTTSAAIAHCVDVTGFVAPG